MMLLENDTRYPTHYLNYKRVQASNVDPMVPMGPNYNGEWLWPVEVDGNSIGFSLVSPDES